MVGPLGMDLRRRVIAAVDDGVSIDAVASQFRVSRRTVYYWLSLRKNTNDLVPKSGYQKGHSHKVKDLEKFSEFIEKHNGKSLKAMAEEWEKLYKESISPSTIGSTLARIGYTLKKKALTMQSQMRSSEQNT